MMEWNDGTMEWNDGIMECLLNIWNLPLKRQCDVNFAFKRHVTGQKIKQIE